MTVYRSANASSATGVTGPSVFRILHVCVANQCRSPIAERLTSHHLSDQVPARPESWAVTSAGIEAANGAPMHQYATGVLTAAGIDADGFTAQRLTDSMIDNADLVLAATAAVRDIVIAKAPAVLPITFTLREFARLAGAVAPTSPANPANPASPASPTSPAELAGQLTPAGTPARARAMVALARRARGRVPFVEPADDDIDDPQRTVAAFEQCAATTGAAVATIVAALTGAAAGTHR